MARHIHLQSHLSVDELEHRYRAAKEPNARTWWQILWLLAQGHTATELSRVIGDRADRRRLKKGAARRGRPASRPPHGRGGGGGRRRAPAWVGGRSGGGSGRGGGGAPPRWCATASPGALWSAACIPPVVARSSPWPPASREPSARWSSLPSPARWGPVRRSSSSWCSIGRGGNPPARACRCRSRSMCCSCPPTRPSSNPLSISGRSPTPV